MIKPINNMDEAEFTCEMRKLYHNLGYPEILQVLYESLKSGEILSMVISEELRNESQKKLEP